MQLKALFCFLDKWQTEMVTGVPTVPGAGRDGYKPGDLELE